MKPQLLETTRLFLALERAADLGAEGVPLAELAEEFGVAASVLQGFLDTLYETADEAASPDELVDWELSDDGVLRVHYAPGLDRELPLGGDEVSALLIGLDRLGLAPDQLDALHDKLLSRLNGTEAARLLQLRQRLSVQSEYRWRRELEQAVDQQSGLRLLYESAHGRGWRRVLPSALVDHQGQLYVGAWCFEREAPRLFRSDRIQDLESWVVDVPPGALPDRAGLARRLARLTDGHLSQRIVLRCLEDDGVWMVRERYGAEAKAEGKRFVLHRYPGEAVANWIVACAGCVVVETPASLVELVRARAVALHPIRRGV
jgi:predicted DNA-binding transcriptional regulator YafY